MRQEKRLELKTIALSQIILLIVGIFAIAYALGSNIGFVSAEVDCSSNWYAREISEEVKFCFGSTSAGFRLYQVIGDDQITNDDYIFKKIDGVWKYYSSGQWLNVDANNFDEYANGAIDMWVELNQQEETETSGDCSSLSYPEDVGGTIQFCYGGGANNEPFHLYKVIGENRIRDDRGWIYRSSTSGTWQYSSDNGGSWLSISGIYFMDDFANPAINLYNSLQAVDDGHVVPEEPEQEGLLFDRLRDTAEVVNTVGDAIDTTRDMLPEPIVNSDTPDADAAGGSETTGDGGTATVPGGEAEITPGDDGTSRIDEEDETKWVPGGGWFVEFIEKLFPGSPNFGFALGHVLGGAVQAIGIYFMLEAFREKILSMGIDPDFFDAAQLAIPAGWFAGKVTYGVLGALQKAEIIALTTAGAFWWAIGIGVGVAAITFLFAYRKTDTVTVQFECKAWNAPLGGSNCDACNEGDFPCSEYQCRSLGAGCEIVNEGDAMLCVYTSEGDREPPVIEEDDDALFTGYKYDVDDSSVSAPNKEVLVENIGTDNGCAPTSTSISFGLESDKAVRCKADTIRRENFDDMLMDFGGTDDFLFEHVQEMDLPSIEVLRTEGMDIPEGQEYELYVKCMDVNGNENQGDFVFRFCIDPIPDRIPPEIVGTSRINNMPVAAGQDSTYLEIYVDDVVNGCKWDMQKGKNYDEMANAMNCNRGDELMDANANGHYTCTTTLQGIEDEQDNYFYFKCEDYAGNKKTTDYELVIAGTRQLGISSVSPNDETIEGSGNAVTVSLEVRTTQGADNGNALCYYSTTGDINDFAKHIFSETNSHSHSTDLSLSEDSYRYYIRCVDIGGNSAEEEVEFDVEVDSEPPVVVRAYASGNDLVLITNEQATCVYSYNTCDYSFEDGVSIASSDDIVHTTDWNTNDNLYIKCKDEHKKQPGAGECSIIVQAFEFY